MRVLFLSPRNSWPPNSGAKLREYHLARALAGQAELTLLAFAADGEALPDGISRSAGRRGGGISQNTLAGRDRPASLTGE